MPQEDKTQIPTEGVEPSVRKLAVAPKEFRRVGPKGIDQRQQQIDPAGHYRVDKNVRPDPNTKQPGGKKL